MKNNIRRLQTLLKIFDISHFSCIEATNYSVSCICKFNSEVLLKALKYKFKLTVSTSGYITLNRGNYYITLTD